MSEALARALVERELKLKVGAIRPLTGGAVGRVFRIDTARGPFVVKLVRSAPEPSFADEPASDRVYGPRWSNLAPAYEILRAHGIAASALHASGEADGFGYAILAWLDGDADDHSPAWFARLGEVLGRLHQITRSFQGWVAMPAPYAEPWSTSFGESLAIELDGARPYLPPTLCAAVAALATPLAAALTDPPEFVFSHQDGFQGMLKREGGDWSLLGVVDIEDHQFTDQRFVLAGFELSQAIAGRMVDPAFWTAYRRRKPVPADYVAFKPLFQAYCLLVWTRVLRERPSALADCVGQLEALTRSA